MFAYKELFLHHDKSQHCNRRNNYHLKLKNFKFLLGIKFYQSIDSYTQIALGYKEHSAESHGLGSHDNGRVPSEQIAKLKIQTLLKQNTRY
jgi:hypothetical protein